MPNVLAITGGGVRGIVVPSVLKQGIALGKISSFDAVTGDSFGALIAAMIGSGWSMDRMSELFATTDFSKLLSVFPWKLRMPTMIVSPVKMDKIARFIDDLRLKPSEKVFINAWHGGLNKQFIYCEKKPAWATGQQLMDTVWIENAFSTHGFGRLITRSMTLPGLLADEPEWMDGGVGEHPPMSFLPADANILCVNLGYAGLVPSKDGLTPRSFQDRAMYMYEVTAAGRQRYAFRSFPRIQVIDPKVYHVDSTCFNISEQSKRRLMDYAYNNTYEQWLPVTGFEEPVHFTDLPSGE